MPPRKKSSTPAKKPTAKKSATKKPTTTPKKPRQRVQQRNLKERFYPPQEMHPFPTFPYRLEYQDGKDTRVCHFECEEHRDKHIKRYGLRKNQYFIDNIS